MRNFDLNGDAPAGSRIAIIDEHGQKVAESKADSKGRWRIRNVAFTNGAQKIYAKATSPRGNIVCSHALALDCEIEREDETNDLDDLLTDEQRREYRVAYWQFVDARAQGYEILMDELKELLPWVGKSLEDFTADALELFDINQSLIDLGSDPNDYPIS